MAKYIRPGYISVAEAAARLGVTPATIRGWGEKGRIGVVKDGARTMGVAAADINRMAVDALDSEVAYMEAEEEAVRAARAAYADGASRSAAEYAARGAASDVFAQQAIEIARRVARREENA